MGVEQPAAYYDAAAASEHYAKDWREAPWLYIWAAIETHISPDEHILDCGCGPGQFARMLYEHGLERYTGIDFSDEMVRQASESVGFDFFVHDLRGGVPQVDYDVAVFSEVLEHISDDVKVLSSLPSGKRVVLSVPNYDDPAHVRRYMTAWYVMDRYKDVVRFDELYWLPRESDSAKGVYIGVGYAR